MTAACHEYRGLTAAIEDGIAELEVREPLGALDPLALWLDLEHIAARLRTLCAEVELEALEAVRAHGENGIGVTASGAARIDRRPRTPEYEGHAILGALAVRVADPNGELVSAVPLEVLRAVVPGCATPDLISSRWTRKALAKRLGADLDQYEHRRGDVERLTRI